MDDLDRAADLINRALDALAIAAVRNPDLRADFARRCERLRLLMDEIDAAGSVPSPKPSPSRSASVASPLRRD
jgi:hypothetical protein